MCGIAGFVQQGVAPEEARHVLADMLGSLRHRGPDDEGLWLDPPAGVALGQRRLSILDLSQAGHQPMADASGRYIIVFNGEIYNHPELRAAVEKEAAAAGAPWRGHSDTEILLACIAAWGVRRALEATVGMFALALWDRHTRTLTLARDRMGEKPLYYGWQRGAFLFASEPKALRRHGAFTSAVDWDVLPGFLRQGYVRGPASIYQGIRKLPAGSMLELRPQDVASASLPAPAAYWSLADAAAAGMDRPFAGSYTDAVDALESLLRRSVLMQSIADVPVGAFLSGGIDSSAVVALMQEAPGARVTTFSIGMPEAGLDESAHAAAVARHLGTDHVAHRIAPAEALELVPRLAQTWDEPFADSSQIPTLLVCRLARQRVTVALSGDGGDELFLGYEQYPMLQRLWRLRQLRHLPWRAGLGAASVLGGHWLQHRLWQARTVVAAWDQPDPLRLSTYWMDRYRQDTVPLRRHGRGTAAAPRLQRTPAEMAALEDAGAYLPDDVLVKVDRAAMACSLETRAPLLDHRIVEFALSLPLAYKLRGGTGKSVLRDVLYRRVPRALVDRPKMGFTIPLNAWLRRELRPWAESLLATIPRDSELLDKAEVERIWHDQASGRRNRADQLWPVLMLAAWCSANGVAL